MQNTAVAVAALITSCGVLLTAVATLIGVLRTKGQVSRVEHKVNGTLTAKDQRLEQLAHEMSKHGVTVPPPAGAETAEAPDAAA